MSGDVDLANACDLQKNLEVLINATTDAIVLDCEGLRFIDSVGVSAFVYAQRLLDVQGRSFRVVNLSPTARKPFEILGLTEVLGITDPSPDPAEREVPG